LIRFVIGPFRSSVAARAAEVYADVDVLFVTPSAAIPEVVARKSRDAFDACGRDGRGEAAGWARVERSREKCAAAPGLAAQDAGNDRAAIGSVWRLRKGRPSGETAFEPTQSEAVRRRNGAAPSFRRTPTLNGAKRGAYRGR
jgi:hypothetical protein